MAVESGRTETPEAKLLGAHAQLLDEARAFVRDQQMKPDTPGERIAGALAGRVIQLGYTVQHLSERSAVVEAEALARSMLSAAVSLLFLCDFDTERRAYLFTDHARALEERVRRSITQDQKGQGGRKGQKRSDKAPGERDTAWRDFFAEFKDVRKGKFGTSPTWHGLTDQTVFELMGWGMWYDMYALFSESVHVGFQSLHHLLDDLVAPDLMPASGGNPYLSLFASHLCLTEAMLQMNSLLKWERREDALAVVAKFRRALDEYARERGRADSHTGPASP